MMSKTYYALTSYGRGLYGSRDLWTEYRRRVLSKIQTVYLLDVDTGCILPCSVSRSDWQDTAPLQLDGLTCDDVVCFARYNKEVDDLIWDSYNPACLSQDLVFKNVLEGVGDSVVVKAIDAKWNLHIMQNGLDDSYSPVRVFNYCLFPNIDLGDSAFCTTMKKLPCAVTLCPLLRCYCDVLSRAQDRAKLLNLSMRSDDFFVFVTRQFVQAFQELPNMGLTHDVGLYWSKSANGYAFGGKDMASYGCVSYMFCFDINALNLKKVHKRGMPFFFIAVNRRNNQRIQAVRSMVEKYAPNAVVRIM